ncbi:MAG: Peptidase C60 sortase A and B [Candidatus Woesebacteria bacterium GW2011_GWA1_37_8]|uniref:Peptidase C60 sortase A and B n=2 Tax=Candidatus Woeseibacteriota TaxID=1752722 RepID=A0A0G0L9H2_9BACT|nr:MAG: Peptidase C60 sortase A and B [Microgenomates group bacterium GW2011_GWC1_37_12b]KKQ45424.1 MAG: Peptidase C60 sortase A and B [Candidatus Woesebacteria bacterium GW2011_GWA1_37_8]KKQ87627.1 MAG: Peptidase C60 sortase A and B [Candidatus Woesebacteria bacterium GW2011_GWB1_38_8b]
MLAKFFGKIRRLSGVFLILAGVFFLLVAAFVKNYSEKVLSFSTPDGGEEAVSKAAKVKEIYIESLNIKLPITESKIENGIWQVSQDGASHLDISANPGEGGNIVLYGHNKANLFGRLTRIKIGQVVELKDEFGITHKYSVESTTTVTPDQIDYVLPKNTETLTFYTCVGFMDSKRFIVTAKPI